MKILQITSSFYPVVGGMEKVVLEISRGLVKRGHEVTVLTTDLYSTRALIGEENLEGIRIVRFKNKYNLRGYGYCPQAMTWLKKNFEKYDVVHSHGYNRYLSEFGISDLSGKVPTVFSPHGFIHTKKHRFAKKIHDLFIGRRIGKADVCTALTKLDLKDYARLRVAQEKIIELPNGVDTKRYKKVDVKRVAALKKKYGLDKNTLLYVGRIHKSKGLQYVVKAIKELDCKLFIVGPDGGYKEELVKQIKEEAVEEKVVFSGAINDEDLVAAYHASDIFVLFSEWEGFGLVVIEAMATGKPVIVSDRGSLPFLVNEGRNGFIVHFPNVNKLKERIESLLGEKDKAKSIGNFGKNFVKKYDWGEIVNQTLNIYKKIMKNS
ncbi:MAG: glycosyltransferase family 4 protein [Nanoarchaeota archaeon]|nr:glycosyltransferase family 4 protein [Nanoarchaeota archaeon]